MTVKKAQNPDETTTDLCGGSSYYMRLLRPFLGRTFIVPDLTTDNQFEHYELLMSCPTILLACSAKIYSAVKKDVLDADIMSDIFPGDSFTTFREIIKVNPRLKNECARILQQDFDTRLQ